MVNSTITFSELSENTNQWINNIFTIKMGNDHSQMGGLDIEQKAIEVTDFWSHHSATLNSGNTAVVSILIGQPLSDASLWVSQTPLEKAGKNLMLHRHPCILKYISSWNKSSKYYLAVEDVKPLSHVLPSQTTLQICIGLHSILKALVFLHEKANASHNNVCIASIYVSKDGSWRLGGLEYLCKFNELSIEYLSRSRSHRYNKAVDPNEEKNVKNSPSRKDCVDAYAFAALVNEVFKNKSLDTLEGLSEFLDTCKNGLQNITILNRPKLSTLLQHSFFNNGFISIHSFLTELPLKSDTERNEFFATLIEKLKEFDENTIASQLGGLLLSRMVLLNKNAQTYLLPFILNPRAAEDVQSNSLFSTDTFSTYIVPKLLDIFCVRDAQIRLLLLEYFHQFLHCFTPEQLQTHILPELLVGIKDTNDHLVSVTLRALADLVPILGSSAVIGGKRAKLFNDGRPIVHTPKPKSRRNSRRSQENITPLINHLPQIENDVLSNGSGNELNLDLPERPSPDGEEGETSTDEVEITINEEEEEVWDDWDINDENASGNQNNTEQSIVDDAIENIEINIENVNVGTEKKPMPDILELDIKNQKNNLKEKSDDFDFFQDMEPVIETSTKFIINHTDGANTAKLDLSVNNVEHHEEGWEDELDWDD